MREDKIALLLQADNRNNQMPILREVSFNSCSLLGDVIVFLSMFCVQSQNQIMYKMALNTFENETTFHEVFKYSKHSGGFCIQFIKVIWLENNLYLSLCLAGKFTT